MLACAVGCYAVTKLYCTSLVRDLQVAPSRQPVSAHHCSVASLPHACCRPSHALYFASYEAAKQLYGGNKEGHHPLAHAAAGVLRRHLLPVHSYHYVLPACCACM